MSELKKNTEYNELIEKIGATYQFARSKVITAVNTEMLKSYWEIGKHIIDFEQGGERKAEYGKALLLNLLHLWVECKSFKRPVFTIWKRI